MFFLGVDWSNSKLYASVSFPFATGLIDCFLFLPIASFHPIGFLLGLEALFPQLDQHPFLVC